MPDTTGRDRATTGGAGAGDPPARRHSRPAAPIVLGRTESGTLSITLVVPDHVSRDLVRRAGEGWEAVDELENSLDGPEFEELTGGNLALLCRDLIALNATLGTGSGPNDRLEYRGILTAHHRVFRELAGEDPSPVERLLCEVAALAWLDYHRCVKRAELAGGSPAVVEYHQRRIQRSHGRYIKSLSALAKIRKLDLSGLVLNVGGAQQVNIHQQAPGAIEAAEAE